MNWLDLIDTLKTKCKDDLRLVGQLEELAGWIEQLLDEVDTQTTQANRLEELLASYCDDVERHRMED